MMEIPQKVIDLLMRQGFVIVSSISPEGRIYCSAKGIASIEPEGTIHLIDLYMGRTISYLKENSTVSITALDEHKFEGYTLCGKARLLRCNSIEKNIMDAWEERIVSRISKRVIVNIQKEKGSPTHPESRFPQPKCLIEVEVEDIVDLAPRYLKEPL